ncbi:MAG: hypothetical protein KGL12_14070 [Rhodospirillales bacterium]|nr:hypothetical protein [Rhodospirillales bacterium]
MALRILADDLTGALDSAARFAAAGPVPVFWRLPEAVPARCAFDSATRDAPAPIGAFAAALAEGAPAFKKIDSVLRGPVGAEIEACAPDFDHVLIAPAFPFQGRVVRGGAVFLRAGDGWRPGPHAFPTLSLPVTHCRPGQRAPAGISLWDSETDADLAAIVAAGRALAGRVLWCGTAGLAGALAEPGAVPLPDLPGPVLALTGTDHPVAVAQLAHTVAVLHRVEPEDPMAAMRIARDLEEAGCASVTVAVPAGMARDHAALRIGEGFAALIPVLPRPGTLVVAGGETLRRLAEALGAQCLIVDGEVAPGIPAARIAGGIWDGVRVIARSGGFGDPALLARLLGLG